MVAVDQRTESAIAWLLESDEPAVSRMARRDLLSEEPGGADRVLSGPKVGALLSGQSSDGGFGVHYYRKWTGAHWRLVSLAEFEVPAQEPRTVAAAESVLRYFEPA
jgi:hypothetical protein